LALLILLAVGFYVRHRANGLPDASSKTYRDAVSAFQISLAAIQVGAEVVAEEQLLRVTALVPQEPAAWANLGLLALRRGTFGVAADRLQRARTLAPENS
jgi:Flp pilus assembly protein TadD